MAAPSEGMLRLARATAFGVSAFALSVVAHVAAGGGVPGVVALLILGIPTTLASVALTARRLRPVFVMLALGGMQFGLHHALMWLAPNLPAGCQRVVLAHAHHGGSQVMACGSSMGGTRVGVSATASPLVMVAAHVLASVLVALLLSRGEEAVWFLCRSLRPTFRPGPIQLRVAPVRMAPIPPLRPGRTAFLRGGLRKRGPPRAHLSLPA